MRRFDHIPYYCEENVWRLLARPELEGIEAWAVAVFGRGASVAVHRQKTGKGEGMVAFWDYHVIALVRPSGAFDVLDLDSTLAFPCPARTYLRESFPLAAFPAGAYGPADIGPPLFRLMPGADFVRRFQSDRSHMIRADGSWIAPPPPWPHPEGGAEGSWSLDSVLSRRDEGPGRLLDLGGLRGFVEAH